VVSYATSLQAARVVVWCATFKAGCCASCCHWQLQSSLDSLAKRSCDRLGASFGNVRRGGQGKVLTLLQYRLAVRLRGTTGTLP
jgi:hypothetical protein